MNTLPLQLTLAATCFTLGAESALGQSSWVQRNTWNVPTARCCGSLEYHAATKQSLLFGGQISAGYAIASTALWDGRTWGSYRGSEPAARTAHASAYDEKRRDIILFGGTTQGPDYDDTWAWNGRQWREVKPTGSRPAARFRHAMARDMHRDRIVLFGGQNSSSGSFADTWEWDGSRWHPRTSATAPAARTRHRMAYDARRRVVVLHGGYDSRQRVYYRDTWEWNGQSWSRVATNGPEVADHTLTYDPSLGRCVLVGGFSRSGAMSDVMEWDGTVWSRRSAAPTIWPVSGHMATFDEARRVLVVFGGFPGSGSQTWEDRYPLDPPGVLRFGRSTAACLGEQRLTTLRDPKAGEWWFGLHCGSVPPSTLGYWFASTTRFANAIPIAGIELSVPPTLVFPTQTNAAGEAMMHVPLPANSRGLRWYTQGVWYNTTGCGGWGSFSATDALQVTVQ